MVWAVPVATPQVLEEVLKNYPSRVKNVLVVLNFDDAPLSIDSSTHFADRRFFHPVVDDPFTLGRLPRLLRE